MHTTEDLRIITVRFAKARTRQSGQVRSRSTAYDAEYIEDGSLPITFKPSDLYGKDYSYRTNDTAIAEGDVVVAEATGTYKLAVVTTVRIFDPLSSEAELNFIAEANALRWVVARIDLTAHKKLVQREADQQRAIKLLEEATKRISVIDKFERVKDSLSAAELAFVAGALGLGNTLPAPQSSGKLDAIDAAQAPPDTSSDGAVPWEKTWGT